MKLLVDLIACQTPTRHRGIGRYTLELTRSLSKLRADNEMILMADPLLPEGFEELRQEFVLRLPAGNFLPYFHGPIRADTPFEGNAYTQMAASLINQARQAMVPDLVLTPSLFEGCGIPQVVVPFPNTKRKSYKQVVILYDLIPYLFHEYYLDQNPKVNDWYKKRFNSLRNFDLLLAISEASRQDAIRTLNIPSEKIVNISSGVDPKFKKKDFSQDEIREILQRLNITRPFVFYLGGNDFRKNMDGALRAFATLPRHQVEQYQLVLNDVGDEKIFRSKFRALGLADQDVVITGRISDDDLMKLYNLCVIFIFPSLYEGFGLPVLEAMACGAPALVANNSSLPEVVGRTDMLFDINDNEKFASVLSHALANVDFQKDLSRYGIERAKQFSWEKSAQNAWQAMENIQKDKNQSRIFIQAQPKKNHHRIAFVSPLPPQQSGISEYSAELLPFLSKYFDIDLFVDPDLIVTDDLRLQSFNTYPWTELLIRRDDYATVVYQFGNSPFHSHMFELGQKLPGVVVLHDFFLSHLSRYVNNREETFEKELDFSHGIKSLIDYQRNGNDVIWNWPINWRILRYTKELIVHSAFQKQLLNQFYNPNCQPHINIIPQLRSAMTKLDLKTKKLAREQLGLPTDCFVICSFGLMGVLKMNEKTIEAFFCAQRIFNRHSRLVFVGDCPKAYRDQIENLLKGNDLKNYVQITGFVDSDIYQKYLAAADIAVQLRQKSRGETSRAVLDCMAYGIPLILNDHGTFNDYLDEDVVKIADPVSIEELSQAMIRLESDEALRFEIGQHAQKTIATKHSPEVAAAAYAEVIKRSIESDDRIVLQPAQKSFEMMENPESEIIKQAKNAAKNLSLRDGPRILIDVSATNVLDHRSGIQRVVKSVVREFLELEDKSLVIEPVFFSDGRLIRASRFVEHLLDFPAGILGEEKFITLHPGDTLFMLDSSWSIYEQFSPIFKEIRFLGGRIITMVYDLIPIIFPQFCDEPMPKIFSKWLDSAISESDQLVCISKTVAEETVHYKSENEISLNRKLDINYFHLGADIPIVTGETTIRKDVDNLMQNLTSSLFLTVSTIEPRKGHAFILDAFEVLWKQGDDCILVIAGKIGWNVVELETRIRNHPMMNKQLFFIENPTDAELEILYLKVTALIIASSAEGYGLPIVEAALHKVPVLASDIPVFREVGSEGAIYFSLGSTEDLVAAVKYVEKLSTEERINMAKKIKTLTWRESAEKLLELIRK